MEYQLTSCPAACNHHEENYVAIVGALDIVTDIMLLLIAVPIVAAMRICPVQKLVWSVCCGGAGVFVIVATALRIYFVYSGNGEQVVFWAMVGMFSPPSKRPYNA